MKYLINEYEFTTDSTYEIHFEGIKNEDNYAAIKIGIDFGEKCSPNPVIIKWTTSGAGVTAIWQPLGGQATMIRPDWSKTQTPSRLACGMPIQLYHSVNGENVITVALKDVKTPCVISSGMYEENACINWELKLFSELTAPMEKYETELIIDKRKTPFYENVEGVRQLWSNEEDKYIPETAKQPFYSTWYSMHQNLSSKELIDELIEAKKYGLNNIIIDDGWQTEDNTRGYTFCGDWMPAEGKVGKIQELTATMHDMGIKCMLWFSIPFVGGHSEAYDKFKDKFIRKTKDPYDDEYTGVLDTRYPEVREYLISTYEKAVKEWKFDGLKLDFIDAIQFEDDISVKDGMDFVSLEDSVEALLKDTYQRLRNINPDVLIEYRQPYVGPVMCKYSNMLRVSDCPKNIIANRMGVINLRLTSGNNAVHSDMLMWSCEESAEDAALQLINVLFSAIQVSMILKRLPEPHRKMLKFYLDFAKRYKKLLLDTPIKAYQPEAGYGMASAEADDSMLSILYLPQSVVVDKKYKKTIIVNGTGINNVIVENKAGEFDAAVNIYDCTGDKKEFKRHISKGVMSFEVPRSGVVEICAL